MSSEERTVARSRTNERGPSVQAVPPAVQATVRELRDLESVRQVGGLLRVIGS
jgi:hypothetical protein